jgi:hypothetical protein
MCHLLIWTGFEGQTPSAEGCLYFPAYCIICYFALHIIGSTATPFRLTEHSYMCVIKNSAEDVGSGLGLPRPVNIILYTLPVVLQHKERVKVG